MFLPSQSAGFRSAFMVAYTYAKGLSSADVAKDRTGFRLHIDTEQGPITLAMNRAGLDHFVTSLQAIEQQATVLDPVAGAAPGESVGYRLEIVDSYQVGTCTVQDRPVMMILKAGPITRAFAISTTIAEAVATSLTNVIPMLESPGPGPH
jgi:hypothetical protein